MTGSERHIEGGRRELPVSNATYATPRLDEFVRFILSRKDPEALTRGIVTFVGDGFQHENSGD